MVVQDVPQQLLISDELSDIYSHGFKTFVDCIISWSKDGHNSLGVVQSWG